MTHNFSCDDLQILIDQGDFDFIYNNIDTMTSNTRRNLSIVINANSSIVPDKLKRKLDQYR